MADQSKVSAVLGLSGADRPSARVRVHADESTDDGGARREIRQGGDFLMVTEVRPTLAHYRTHVRRERDVGERESVELFLTREGVPSLMRWGETDYEVIDRPTRLEVDVPFVTHPPSLSGWRFTGRCADDVRVFDVVRALSASGWRLFGDYV